MPRSDDAYPPCERNGWADSIARLHTLFGHLSLPEDPAEARRYLDLARSP